MAVGLPIVVPNSGGIRETVNPGVSGWLSALDHRALAKPCVRLPAVRSYAVMD